MISLREQVERISQDSGIYLFIDATDTILYIGKAKRLKTRLLQYINGHDDRQMVSRLMKRAKRIEITITASEKDALILEANLIQKHKPPFNVRLIDGSNFLFLGIQKKKDWPYPYIVRRSKAKKRERLIGPFPSARGVRDTLQFIERNFMLRTCSDHELLRRNRPCLQYQMHQCLAPCVSKCTPEEYREELERVLFFMRGKNRQVIEKTQERMLQFAAQERFEEAMKCRDLIRSLEKTLEKQQVLSTKNEDRDIWGIHLEGEQGAIAILPFRDGMMQESIVMFLPQVVEDNIGLLLSTILVEWYHHATIPKSILLEESPPNKEAIEEVLEEELGQKMRILVPKRGEKKKWVALAKKNAMVEFTRQHSEQERVENLLLQIQKICGLPRIPRRIECFDNSHLGGTNPVACMVTFVNGTPKKSLYRKFRIPEALGGDDYGSMENVLMRRFTRATQKQKGWELPDLLVVDGGRGQLNIALSVLSKLGCSVPCIGIAKPRTEHQKGMIDESDKLILAHVKDPVRLPKHNPVLRLLQHLRDETHAQAVAYQQKTRQKNTLSSVLQGISGLGPQRQKALLKHFKSIAAIKKATTEELQQVNGISKKIADVIVEYWKTTS